MSRQSRAPTILLTRPAEGAARFAAGLPPGVPVMLSPLMAPRYLHPAVPDLPFRAVIFTSEAGVEAARRISATGQAWPERAFCVGSRTGRQAAAAGFQAQSAEGDAEALRKLIAATGRGGPLLYLRGRDVAGDLAEKLNLAGIETHSLIVYDQVAQKLTAAALQLLQEQAPVVLPLFSPRSARLLAAALRDRPAHAPLWVAALGPAVAVAAADLHPARLLVAQHPDAAAMQAAVAALLVAAEGS